MPGMNTPNSLDAPRRGRKSEKGIRKGEKDICPLPGSVGPCTDSGDCEPDSADRAQEAEKGSGIAIVSTTCLNRPENDSRPLSRPPDEYRQHAGGGHDGVADGLLVQRPQTERPGVLARVDEPAGRNGVDGGLGIFATDGRG